MVRNAGYPLSVKPAEELVNLCWADGVPLSCSASAESPRDRVKTLVLQDVLAKRGNYPSPFEAVFRRGGGDFERGMILCRKQGES